MTVRNKLKIQLVFNDCFQLGCDINVPQWGSRVIWDISHSRCMQLVLVFIVKTCQKMCRKCHYNFCSANILQVTYRSGTVNSNTVNSKFHLIRSYYEIVFYHFPNIPCLKCTVNLNFHLIRSKILPTNDFELTVPDLYLNWRKFFGFFFVEIAYILYMQHFVGQRLPESLSTVSRPIRLNSKSSPATSTNSVLLRWTWIRHSLLMKA